VIIRLEAEAMPSYQDQAPQSTADLELTLRRQGTNYTVELCFRPELTAPEIDPLANLPTRPLVQFDHVKLNTVAHAPLAYGRTLADQFYADPGFRMALKTVRDQA
jgi:hypothetical protein